jgi:hypothetical protein
MPLQNRFAVACTVSGVGRSTNDKTAAAASTAAAAFG